MSLWGSVMDPGKDIPVYQVPTEEDVLPPTATSTPSDPGASTALEVSTTSSRTIPRPTEHLPGDHGDSEGEKSKPAFTTTTGTAASTETAKPAEDVAESASASASPSATIVPTPDEGWFSDLSNLVTNQMWFFVAIGAVVLFGIGAGLFFWRRAVMRKRRANYSSLRGDDDVAMGSIGRMSGGSSRGPQRTKELYDAFGEVSDDEDADEETALRPHSISPGLDTGLHSGFLEDDDPPTGGSGGKQSRYRDEPDSPVEGEKVHDRSDSPGSASGSGTGSGSSWEHASEMR